MSVLLLGGSVAAAAEPERIPISFTHTSTDTEICATWGLAVDVVEVGYGFVEVFYDAAGEVTRMVLHLTVDYSMTANGVTVLQRDRKERFVTDETLREMGEGHIIGPNGSLALGGGGQLVITADGTETLFGRPPELDPDAFCRVFADGPA